jgi:hypothetical protein
MFLEDMLFIDMNNIQVYLRNHFFAVLVFTLFLIFIPVAIYLSFGTKSTTPQIETPTVNAHPTPIPSDFTKSYNSLNQLIPGKSTLRDIEKVNGPAISSSQSGNKLFLYYQTQSVDYQNTAVLKNGALYYSLENVFGDYRGSYSDYTTAYGEPSLYLYNRDDTSSEWFIFLKQGIGVEVSSGEILRILFFTPQQKDVFIKNIAMELGLVVSSPEGQSPYEPFGF